MSECRFYPLCDMSDERCETSAQCSLFEAMPDVARLSEIADKMIWMPRVFPGRKHVGMGSMVELGVMVRRAIGR